jgi:hypothetical protein
VKGLLLSGFLICLIGKLAFSQGRFVKVTGKVSDITNGSPLAGASVTVENSKSGVKTNVDRCGTLIVNT